MRKSGKFRLLAFGFIAGSCVLFSCTNSTAEPEIETIVKEFYQVYQDRNDFNRFLSFYADDIILEDIINGDRILGKTSFAKFFNWNHPDYSREKPGALVIENIIVEGNRAVAKGYFTEFKWQGKPFEAMHFTTLLKFNKQGQISEQIDWVNYPNNLVDYTNRNNSNLWITSK